MLTRIFRFCDPSSAYSQVLPFSNSSNVNTKEAESKKSSTYKGSEIVTTDDSIFKPVSIDSLAEQLFLFVLDLRITLVVATNNRMLISDPFAAIRYSYVDTNNNFAAYSCDDVSSLPLLLQHTLANNTLSYFSTYNQDSRRLPHSSIQLIRSICTSIDLFAELIVVYFPKINTRITPTSSVSAVRSNFILTIEGSLAVAVSE